VGLTTLLSYAAIASPDERVILVKGTVAERDLAFAGIHRLCFTVLDRLNELPAPPSAKRLPPLWASPKSASETRS
jgi:hypothetical protein